MERRRRLKRKSAKNTFLSFFFLMLLFFVTDFLLLESKATSQINEVLKENFKKGRITVVTTDQSTQEPIAGVEYVVYDMKGEIIDFFTTDQAGFATSRLLNYKTAYTLKQRGIPIPYEQNSEAYQIEILDSNNKVSVQNLRAKYIKSYVDGEIEKLTLAIPTVMQYPELPHGCEITALTAILNFYGYEVSKTHLSDNYLPKQPFTTKNNKRYGANPYHYYAGEPRHQTGFFAYAPPIQKAAEAYLAEVGGHHVVYNISGSSQEEIMEQLRKGIPIIVWVTLDLSPPLRDYSWFFHGTDTKYIAPRNLHAVVLTGFKDNQIYAMDPLKGQVTHDADRFFKSYQELGTHALMVVDPWKFWKKHE